MSHLIKLILRTDVDYLFTALRLIAGIVIWPYGMQKLFGWFGGVGIKGTLEQMTVKRIPGFVAWLVIIGQSFGSMALVLGFFGRLAAAGLFIIFTGALVVHLPNGWTMNWFGEKKGEGNEYHILLLTLLFAVIVKGSGALSIDLWLIQNVISLELYASS